MYSIVLLFLAGLLAALLIGIPIVYGLGFISLTYLFLTRGFSFPADLIVVPMVQSLNSFILIAVPLFFFVGKLMNESGLTDRLFGFAESLVGHFRGGLAHVNVVSNMIFAGMSGSAAADAAGPGAVAYKAMVNQGYDPEFSAGLSCASALIGPIIPPSIPVMIYASMAEVSATGLLMAGLLPGILIGLLQMAVVAYLCRQRPHGRRASLSEVAVTFKRAFLIMLTPLILVWGIVGGVFTATEAAAVACVYLLVLILAVYRTVSWTQLVRIIRETVLDSAVVMFLLSTATLYGWLLTRARIPTLILESLLSVSHNGYVLVGIVVVFLLIMGCFFSTAVGLILVSPIVAPVAAAAGFDPIHFGIIVVITMVIGSATPPVGADLYTIVRVTRLPVETVCRGMLPFLYVTVLAVVIVTFVPSIALIVPRIVLGH
jgi:tripartite ATP-independent transporter DctM subunit